MRYQLIYISALRSFYDLVTLSLTYIISIKETDDEKSMHGAFLIWKCIQKCPLEPTKYDLRSTYIYILYNINTYMMTGDVQAQRLYQSHATVVIWYQFIHTNASAHTCSIHCMKSRENTMYTQTNQTQNPTNH